MTGCTVGAKLASDTSLATLLLAELLSKVAGTVLDAKASDRPQRARMGQIIQPTGPSAAESVFRHALPHFLTDQRLHHPAVASKHP